MSAISRKSKQVIESEIRYCEEMAKSHFDMELNHLTLEKQIGEIISEKIEGYFYQRFRDWLVADLLTLKATLADADKAAKAKAKKAYKESLQKAAEEHAGIDP